MTVQNWTPSKWTTPAPVDQLNAEVAAAQQR